VVENQEKYLFFERPIAGDDAASVGRWFVEAPDVM
jgi:hypothetical protein